MSENNECRLKELELCDYREECESRDDVSIKYKNFHVRKWSNKISRSRVGVICTIGPSVFDSEEKHKINELIYNGMNIARINLSHYKLEKNTGDNIPKYLEEELKGLKNTFLEKIKDKGDKIPGDVGKELKSQVNVLWEKIKKNVDEIPKHLDKELEDFANTLWREIKDKGDDIPKYPEEEPKDFLDKLLKKVKDKIIENSKYLDKEQKGLVNTLLKKIEDKGDELTKCLDEKLKDFTNKLTNKDFTNKLLEEIKDKGDEIPKCLDEELRDFANTLPREIKDKGDKLTKHLDETLKNLVREKEIKDKRDEVTNYLDQEMKSFKGKLLEKIKNKKDEIPKLLNEEGKDYVNRLEGKIKDEGSEFPEYLDKKLAGLVNTLQQKIEDKVNEIAEHLDKERNDLVNTLRMPKKEGEEDVITKHLNEELKSFVKTLLKKIKDKVDEIPKHLDIELGGFVNTLWEKIKDKGDELTKYLDKELKDFAKTLLKKIKYKGSEFPEYLDIELEGLIKTRLKKMKDKVVGEIPEHLKKELEGFANTLWEKIKDKGDDIPKHLDEELKGFANRLCKKIKDKGFEIPKYLEEELMIFVNTLWKKIKNKGDAILKPIDSDLDKLVDYIKTIRRCSDRLRIPVNIMLDLKGPEIRVSHFLIPDLGKLTTETKMEIKKESRFTIVLDKPVYPIEVKNTVLALSKEKEKEEDLINEFQEENEYRFTIGKEMKIIAECIKKNDNKSIDFKVTKVTSRDQRFILEVQTKISISGKEDEKDKIDTKLTYIYGSVLQIAEDDELILADKKILENEKKRKDLFKEKDIPVILLDYDGNFDEDIAVHNSDDPIYLDDGNACFKLKIESDTKNKAKRYGCPIVEVESGEKVELRKSMNLFNNARKSAEFISDTDRIYLKEIFTHPAFKDSCPIDSIAVSFVRNSSDLNRIDTMLRMFGVKGKKNWNIKLIAKIESPHCFMKRYVYNQDRFDQEKIDYTEYEEILKNKLCWAIMVARGDLGVEIKAEKVPEVQQQLTDRANIAGKGVIVATQMLLSMLNNTRPSRADVTDVHNAVLSGADVVMLSEETAKGKYPLKALEYMRKIVNKAVDELMLDENRSIYLKKILKAEEVKAEKEKKAGEKKAGQIMELLGEPMVNISLKSGSPVIFSYALTGGTVTKIPKYRPDKPIIAITNSEMAAKNMLFYFGVFPMLVVEKEKDKDKADFDFPRDVKEYRKFIRAIVNRCEKEEDKEDKKAKKAKKDKKDKEDKEDKKYIYLESLKDIKEGEIVFGLLGIDDKASYLSDRAIVIFRL